MWNSTGVARSMDFEKYSLNTSADVIRVPKARTASPSGTLQVRIVEGVVKGFCKI